MDALEPIVLAALIKDEVEQLIDEEKWDKTENLEREQRELLQSLSENMNDITDYLLHKE